MDPKKVRETWLFNDLGRGDGHAGRPGRCLRQLCYRRVELEDGTRYIQPLPMSTIHGGTYSMKGQDEGPYVTDFQVVSGHPYPAFCYGPPRKDLDPKP